MVPVCYPQKCSVNVTVKQINSFSKLSMKGFCLFKAKHVSKSELIHIKSIEFSSLVSSLFLFSFHSSA